MTVTQLDIAGYRSVKRMVLPVHPVTVVVGANGSGKTNLYRALYLLQAAAEGRLARTLAEEGGTPSVVWAGPREHKQPVRMKVGVTLEDELAYELSCGIVPKDPSERFSLFVLDPEVKEEHLWALSGGRRAVLMERKDRTAFLRDSEGKRAVFPSQLWSAESVLDQLAEPQRFPRLTELQRTLKAWRFYHQFRTDLEAPARQPQIGVRTTALAHDGRDLAAALATIREIGDRRGLEKALEDAFPGAQLDVKAPQGRFSLSLHLPGLTRPMEASELSDGTLRYLCLLAALLSPRPPPFLALNEPETSLHPDLLGPLARLIVEASKHSQIWITTHAEPLAEAVSHRTGYEPVRLVKKGGATEVVGAKVGED
ncbi:AAA family ATPase [Stigmatella sp. ncwal1]|uniref:AAA family ATPase n=1 Tax=Stigmatella ashevillensis TaxID=2995309 RepID=A0ABT5DF25_9BACT|nr:AAA family ATPase [Stigmatella ashevillena]MDC0712272.1 AAA family ATPase [Stigmatella ashevillena]